MQHLRWSTLWRCVGLRSTSPVVYNLVVKYKDLLIFGLDNKLGFILQGESKFSSVQFQNSINLVLSSNTNENLFWHTPAIMLEFFWHLDFVFLKLLSTDQWCCLKKYFHVVRLATMIHCFELHRLSRYNYPSVFISEHCVMQLWTLHQPKLVLLFANILNLLTHIQTHFQWLVSF